MFTDQAEATFYRIATNKPLIFQPEKITIKTCFVKKIVVKI